MQFNGLCVFTIVFGYSLVISAPINQNSYETQHEKVTAMASHLLKELADEQSSNKESQKIELDNKNQQDENEIDIPTIDVYYPIDDTTNDTDSSSEILDIHDTLPMEDQYFDDEFMSIIHTPIIDDDIMKTESH